MLQIDFSSKDLSKQNLTRDMSQVKKKNYV